MVVCPSDGSNVGGRITGDGYLRLPMPEHSRTVYCDQSHYGPVSGDGEASGVKGGQAVTGRGRIGLGQDVDSGPGRRTDRGGGVDRTMTET